jgi:hypothetical protein
VQHVFYAAFDDVRAGEAAVRELEARGERGAALEVAVHRDARDRFRTAERPLYETRARRGLEVGAGLGAAVGAAGAGLLVVLAAPPTGVVGTLVLGAVWGALLGAFGGALTGSGDPDPTLERLEERLPAGGLVVTVAAANVDAEDAARRIVEHHGARVARHR